MKVLIIDDSRTRRRILASYLSEFTTDIHEAATEDQALGQLQLQAPFDLVFVDWENPKMISQAFIKTVRAAPSLAETRLLVLASRHSFAEVLIAGGTDFLIKPITGKMLEDKIRLLGLNEAPPPARRHSSHPLGRA